MNKHGYNVISSRPHLNKMITGTCCHSFSIVIIGDIVYEIFVLCIDGVRLEHYEQL